MTISIKEAIKAIKTNLKTRTGKTWSVKQGRGTSMNFIEITAPPARLVHHEMTDADRAELTTALGFSCMIHPQGIMVDGGPNAQAARREMIHRSAGVYNSTDPTQARANAHTAADRADVAATAAKEAAQGVDKLADNTIHHYKTRARQCASYAFAAAQMADISEDGHRAAEYAEAAESHAADAEAALVRIQQMVEYFTGKKK